MYAGETRPLGRSGLSVSVAGFGGGGLGNFYRSISNAEADALLNAAWDAGLRYFDTAPFYGRGRSERRLGAFLDAKPRESYVLSTKVGRLLKPARGALQQDGIFFDLAPFNPHYDYSYDGVMRSHDDSLQRLGLDRIDVLYVHDIGVFMHGENADAYLTSLKTGGLKALEELRRGGAIKAYGLGVNETAACFDCLEYSDPDALLLAGRYTLLEPNAALPLLDACLERKVSLVIGGVFNSGILATGSAPGGHHNYGDADAAILQTVRRLEAVCARHDVPLSAAALQFPFSHPAVASVLLGVGTISSLTRNIEGLRRAIPTELWRELRAEIG